MKNALFASIVLLLPLISGCATIIKGTTQDIPISSEPPGAALSVDGHPRGSTPTKVTLSRKHTHVVTLEMDGFEAENVTIKPSMGGAVVGNLIAGGLIGWGVDASTGAQYNLHPDTVNVRLRPLIQQTGSLARDTAARLPTDDLRIELENLDAMKNGGKVSDYEFEQLRAGVLKKYKVDYTDHIEAKPTEPAPIVLATSSSAEANPDIKREIMPVEPKASSDLVAFEQAKVEIVAPMKTGRLQSINTQTPPVIAASDQAALESPRFSSLGLKAYVLHNQIWVHSVASNSAAAAAGIQPGDEIVAFDKERGRGSAFLLLKKIHAVNANGRGSAEIVWQTPKSSKPVSRTLTWSNE